MKKHFLAWGFTTLIGITLAAGGTGEVIPEATDYAMAESITVTDDRGKEITLKGDVQRIATFPLPHPHIIAAIDGGVDRIIGASSMSVSAAEVSVLGKIYPQLSQVDTGYLKGQTLNVEELARIKPDVFFTDSVLEGMENLEETGIPVVYMGLKKEDLSYRGNNTTVYSPKETMKDWVSITSQVLGKNESSASEIAALWEDTEREIEAKLQTLSDGEKKKVLILFKTRALAAAGQGTFGHYWIIRTGGINAAEGLAGKHPAMAPVGNFEEIMKWNPDIIYLSNFEDTMPEDLYENRIDGQDWSSIEAVKQGRVYRIPLGIYRWYPPSLDGPLMLKWMAQTNYPDLFDYDLESEIRDYFSRFHHYDLTGEEIDAILHPQSSGTL